MTARVFFVVLALIGAVYAFWLLTFWPGILGEDSVAILLETQPGSSFHSGKTTAWYFFVRALAGPTGLVEIPIAVQLLLCAIFFARILAWCWQEKMRIIFFFSLFFVCLAPHMVYFASTLYPDGLYAVAVCALLFELWLISTTRKVGVVSALVVAIALPIALFFRSNGILFLIAILWSLYGLNRRDKAKLIALTLFWGVLNVTGGWIHKTGKHGVMFPLAVYETVNFLQPHPMGLWYPTPRVSEQTIKVLQQHKPLDEIIPFYDRDYWDPLIYSSKGPTLGAMPDAAKGEIVSEFWRYNLWRNFPAFAGSRVNIFFVAAFGQGGFPDLGYAEAVIERTKSESRYRLFQMHDAEALLRKVYDFSYNYRGLFWTPFLGIFLLVVILRRGWGSRDHAALLVSVPALLQLAAIFAFSIAGEYRYLLPFFVMPVALLPMLAAQHRLGVVRGATTGAHFIE